MRQFKRKRMVLLMMFLLLFVLIGCDSSVKEENTSSEPNQNDKGAKDKSDEDTSDTVIVYTAGPKALAEDILEGFEASTGIKIEQFQATTGKILGRLEAEKSNPVADVVVLASWPSAVGLKEDGLTMAYPEAAHSDKLQSDWKDADNHLFGYSASALGITYNTDLVMNPPTDWSDFTHSDWENQINIPDPSLSGSALDFISGYLNEFGEDGWKMYSQLNENGVELAGANKEALDPVITGSKSAVMAGVDYMAYHAKSQGEPIDIIYPTSGTVINPRPAMILKDAQNEENAKQFIDYLLSEEGQQLVTESFLLPGRTDIEAKDRTDVDDIKRLNYDWEWMMENSDEINSKFQDTFR